MTAAPPIATPPAPRRSRWPIVLAIVAVAAVVAAVALGSGWFGGSASGSPVPSSSVEGVVPADAGVVAEGRAVPVTWAEVAPAMAGRVVAVPVEVGDEVGAGDVLVQLDAEAADLEVESAQAAQAAAQAATARAAASLDQAKANVTAATAAVAQAQAGRRAADAARDALPGAASNAQERQADAQVDQAEAQVDSARAQRTAAIAAQRIAASALEAATADEQRARLAVDAAILARDHLAVTSPIAGTVVEIVPAAGDLAQPGAVVARVADTSGWRFETTDLSETSIARVREGAPVSITVDGLPGEEIAGAVESVGTYGSSSQGDIVYRVVVAPAGEVPDGLRWNMTVTMEIEGVPAGS